MTFLTKEEERVIGCLIEKKFTTPEYYPLTLNSLKNACNQKSNRDPVVDYTEDDVDNVIDKLFDKKMVFKVSGSDHRVPKYNENFTKFFELSQPEVAVMCLLMLRGPQTIGELRGRTSRIYNFEDLSEVERTLSDLINKESEYKFVVKLPRTTGRDPRYSCALAGEPDLELLKPKKKFSRISLINFNPKLIN
jgi:uncharacterized protein YceH (UPF0502 family)